MSNILCLLTVFEFVDLVGTPSPSDSMTLLSPPERIKLDPGTVFGQFCIVVSVDETLSFVNKTLRRCFGFDSMFGYDISRLDPSMIDDVGAECRSKFQPCSRQPKVSLDEAANRNVAIDLPSACLTFFAC